MLRQSSRLDITGMTGFNRAQSSYGGGGAHRALMDSNRSGMTVNSGVVIHDGTNAMTEHESLAYKPFLSELEKNDLK